MISVYSHALQCCNSFNCFKGLTRKVTISQENKKFSTNHSQAHSGLPYHLQIETNVPIAWSTTVNTNLSDSVMLSLACQKRLMQRRLYMFLMKSYTSEPIPDCRRLNGTNMVAILEATLAWTRIFGLILSSL